MNNVYIMSVHTNYQTVVLPTQGLHGMLYKSLFCLTGQVEDINGCFLGNFKHLLFVPYPKVSV